MLALEWPLPLLAGTSIHRSIEFRLAMLPLTALACLLMYQSTNPGIYYLIGMGAYFWAYSEGEVCSSSSQFPPPPLFFLCYIKLTLLLGYLRTTMDSTSPNTKLRQQSLISAKRGERIAVGKARMEDQEKGEGKHQS